MSSSHAPPGNIPAFISLGSNLGDLEDNLERARNAMSALNDVQLTACSPVYYTEPQDVRNQPWFANQVVLLDCRTVWTAPDLLQALLGIESQMGRIRGQSKGPRIIDLDLLLFGTQHHASRDLILPHPRIQDRAFVLIPLLDIAPYLSLPDGTNLSKALERLSFHVHDRRIEQAEEG